MFLLRFRSSRWRIFVISGNWYLMPEASHIYKNDGWIWFEPGRGRIKAPWFSFYKHLNPQSSWETDSNFICTVVIRWNL